MHNRNYDLQSPSYTEFRRRWREQIGAALSRSERNTLPFALPFRELRLPATVIAPVYFMDNLFNPWNLATIGSGVLSTPVPPALRLEQVATLDVLALSVLAIEHPDVFAGERIELASDAPPGEEAASVLPALLGRRLTGRQLVGPGLPPGLGTLFAWLERDPSPADIGALRGRFPGIAWRSFGAWPKPASPAGRGQRHCPASSRVPT